MSSIFKSRWASFLLLLVGIAGVVVLIKTGPQPQKNVVTEQEHVVSAIRITPTDVVPWVTGYGEVQPSKTWKAVAQVASKVSWKSPKLKGGEFFKSGELLLNIDDSETKLKVLLCEADIKKCKAKIEELQNSKTSMESQLEILRKILTFQEKELKRQQSLLEAKTSALVTVENQEVAVLQQRKGITDIESNLKLLPSQIAYQEATLAAAEVSLAQKKLELDYAKINAPFDCRIDSVSVEEWQYVTIGQTMFVINAIDEVEIPVQFTAAQIGLLINPSGTNGIAKIPEEKRKLAAPLWKIDVAVNIGTQTFTWDGEFRRMAAGIDTTTRMINMVVGVPSPYRFDQKVMRPPLEKGSFCTVTIHGKEQQNLLIVPRYAIHDGQLYIANKDSRLEMIPIKVSYNLGQYAIVNDGLTPGETVLLSDLVPAMKGMKLKVIYDESFYTQVKKELGGREDAQ